jgi:hypothetical protein
VESREQPIKADHVPAQATSHASETVGQRDYSGPTFGESRHDRDGDEPTARKYPPSNGSSDHHPAHRPD